MSLPLPPSGSEPKVDATTCPASPGNGLATAGGEAPPAPTDRARMRAGLSAEEVRRRIAGSARNEEAERRLLAFYLVEMDARRLYQETGHGSTVHYAEARHGLDRRRVAELVRVGAKLLELRLARGRQIEDFDGTRLPDGRSALWARVADLPETTAPKLAVLGDRDLFHVLVRLVNPDVPDRPALRSA